MKTPSQRFEALDPILDAPDSPVTVWLKRHPVWTLVIIAALCRILAALFAKGFMIPDDHFLTIEVADAWLKGENTWYTGKIPMRGILYPYTVTALMWALKQLTITAPDTVMFFIRLTHALWSLLTIPLIYHAVKRFSDEKTAFTAGLIGAVFYLMPFMAVRNLPEVLCQPPILAGLILADCALRADERGLAKKFFAAGILLGLGFLLRYQNVVFPLAALLYITLKRRWKAGAYLTLGALIMTGILAVIDGLSYSGFQFTPLNLLRFQASHVQSYVTNPVYTHFTTILLAFIPPFSFLMVWFIIRAARKAPVMFWAAFGFLLIHSLIPQKQERFILPLFPVLVTLGMIGYAGSITQGKRWMRGLWVWFWAVNTVLLIITTFNYSQKARVESLVRLGKIPDAAKVIILSPDHPVNPPWFYLDGEIETTLLRSWDAFDGIAPHLIQERRARPEEDYYVVIFTHKPLEHYIERIETKLGLLEQVDHIKPSLVDALLHFMNPRHNHSKEAYIFRWD